MFNRTRWIASIAVLGVAVLAISACGREEPTWTYGYVDKTSYSPEHSKGFGMGTVDAHWSAKVILEDGSSIALSMTNTYEDAVSKVATHIQPEDCLSFAHYGTNDTGYELGEYKVVAESLCPWGNSERVKNTETPTSPTS